MPICRQCHAEYPTDVIVCPKCGEPLTPDSRLPSSQRVTLDLSFHSEVFRSESQKEAMLLVALLGQHNIPSRQMDFDPKTSSVVHRVMVPKRLRAQAQTLVEQFEQQRSGGKKP